MSAPRRAVLALAGALAALLMLAPAASAASAWWHLSATTAPTHLASNGEGKIVLAATNLGYAPVESAGDPVRIADQLPPGLSATAIEGIGGPFDVRGGVECPSLTECSFANTLSPYEQDEVIIAVKAEGAQSGEVNEATLSGGGLPPTSTSQTLAIDGEPTPFGIESYEFSPEDENGSPETQAGSHPFQLTTPLSFNQTADPAKPPALTKDVAVDLPPGLVGNPNLFPRCTSVQFTSIKTFGENLCPPDTAVGVAVVRIDEPSSVGLATLPVPVVNLEPGLGEPARFGFYALNTPVILDTSIRTGSDYGVRARVANVSETAAVLASQVTLWGTPGDPRHDASRGTECVVDTVLYQRTCTPQGLSQPEPFLTLPTSCTGPLQSSAQADSWPTTSDPAGFDPPPVIPSSTPSLEGCGALPFEPSIALTPDTQAAATPSGLAVGVHVPQQSGQEPASSHLKDALVKLPAGLAVNPSSAAGLGACSPAQIELHGPQAPSCPDAAKLGTVEAHTPLLDHPLAGAIYLATPYQNPFDSLLAIYIVVDDPQSGTVVKLAGQVQSDPQTGQLTTSVQESPQFPVEDLAVRLFGGPRAPLATPALCGKYTAAATFTPWSGSAPVDSSSSFEVNSGPGGSACANTEPGQPNKPSFEAGTTNSAAGRYSPFVLHLHREDGSQTFKALNLTLPPGLTGKLAGVGECSEAQLQAAEHNSGQAEKQSPSCPASSELGTVNVGAGAGPDPYYVQGRAYLSGPYKGAPLSMVIVTPAVAGPFDLGTVVVRSALYVNPETAQITIRSDPIPQILAGIPLDVRSIAVNVSRNQFTLNPTDCNPLSLSGEVLASASTANVSSPFQVGGCNALPFHPKLSLALKGKTTRTGHPALSATLTAKPGEANIARAQVTLPHSEFLDNAHIGTVCTRVQFSEGAGNGAGCPPASVYGFARAVSPLLDQPLQGPVYLRSSDHKLPDLVAALNGQIDVALDGKVDTGKGGGIRNTFEVVPDAPVSKFTLSMAGGKKGLLVNSENLCSTQAKTHASVNLTAQNGKTYDTTPVVANSCPKARGKHRMRGAR